MTARGTGNDASGLAAIRELIAGSARGDVRLPLLSGSMAPTVLPGDIVLVRGAAGHGVHTGDIAVFIKNGRLTAHRVIFSLTIGPLSYLLEMGDANRVPARLHRASVLGFVVSVERDGEPVPFDRRSDASRRIARESRIRSIATLLRVERIRRMLSR